MQTIPDVPVEGLQTAASVLGIAPSANMLLALGGVVQAVFVLVFVISPMGGAVMGRSLRNAGTRWFVTMALVVIFNVISGGGILLLKYVFHVNQPDSRLALVSLIAAIIVTLLLGTVAYSLMAYDAKVTPKSTKADPVGKEFKPDIVYDGLGFDEKRRERLKKQHDYRNRRAR